MTEDNETVTIAREEYEYSLNAKRILDALYAGGVDNWEFYDLAIDSLDDD